ncbi:FERM domain-containing protein 4A-like [Molossus nigricans]
MASCSGLTILPSSCCGPEPECLKQEFAIQSQITEAARYLTSDTCVSKKLKKQWKPSHLNSLTKLQELENAVNKNCIKSGKKPTQRTLLIIDDENIGSEDSSLSDALVLEDEIYFWTLRRWHVQDQGAGQAHPEFYMWP